MSEKAKNLLRRIASQTNSLYHIDFKSYVPMSDKAFKCKAVEGNEYFVKKTDLYTQEKYRFLYHQGVDNVLYPLENTKNEYISKNENDEYYIMPFVSDFYMLDEIKAGRMIDELIHLHKTTSFQKNLSVSHSRRKVEEILDYLNYKFSLIESFIRTLEAQDFDEYSIPILKNYHILLDSKKIMIKYNKKIIYAIKESKSVYYCFLHNNPKLDHLLITSGRQYLVSIENGKIGIPSLDIAKFYVENCDLNIDMKTIIKKYFSMYDDDFYFDYFCFLVFLIYIKGLIIDEKDYITTQSFLYTTQSIEKFIHTFDLDEQIKTTKGNHK